MSRRDTIVVAVLINVALLGLLFATAVNGPEEVVKQAEPIRYTAAPPAPTPALIPNLPQAPAKTSVPVPSQVASKPLLLLPRQTDIEAPVRPVEVVAKVEPPAPQPIVQRAAPAPLPKLDPTEVTVTVKRGDVLSKIAAANGTTVDAIMKANSLESTTLQIGQQLKVPLNTVTKAKPQVPPPVKPMQEGGVYTVQKGDSPWSIARKHDVSLGELLELNHLNEDSARRLRPGDKLRVR